MGSRFLASAIVSFVATLTVLAAAGLAFSVYWTPVPRDPFRTGFYEFDMAEGWTCDLVGTEYVCSPAGKPPHAATVIIAAKFRSEADNLKDYEAHLRKPQKHALAGAGGAGESKINYVRRRTLGGREWVEALHLGSELPNFYTYYLATATAGLGILVTMSVHKDHEAEHAKSLVEMMSTLHTYQR
jgi:hypothetical protein